MSATRVLVVDDNAGLAKAVQRYLQARGCEARSALTVADARRMLEEQAVDILFVDYSLPDGTGADLVRWAFGKNRMSTAYCITGVAISGNVVEAMRAGCRDVLEKPFDLERLDPLLDAAAHPPTEIGSWRSQFAPNILGDDHELLRVLCTARDVAESNSTVLVTGESGTGKELMAQAIHRASGRRGPFIALNCAALPETLMEAELFGHTKGAFTGAVQARAGHIQAADGGTLFLDEIGDMPLAAQARLLRVLQEKRVTPIGADRPVDVDVRVVAATHKNLEDMVENQTFREDLYYRLSVIPIHLPPLRNRTDDVVPLAQALLAHHNRQSGKAQITISADAEVALKAHSWPGNVRELAHTIERACLLARNGRITAESLGGPMRRLGRSSAPPPARGNHVNGHGHGHVNGNANGSSAPLRSLDSGESLNLKAALDSIERDLIQRALERTSGNRTEAAALLGLNRTTLVEKLRKLE